MKFGSVRDAVEVLRNGGVIAYPTEYCFGLGCDPSNQEAVRRILKIKRRSWKKGLILIADHYSRLQRYVSSIPPGYRNQVFDSWPGPVTWLLPARKSVSGLIRGTFDSVAVRVTPHPVAHQLSALAGTALISTSANRASRKPARTVDSVLEIFDGDLDFVVAGRVGSSTAPSTIRDAVSGSTIR